MQQAFRCIWFGFHGRALSFLALVQLNSGRPMRAGCVIPPVALSCADCYSILLESSDSDLVAYPSSRQSLHAPPPAIALCLRVGLRTVHIHTHTIALLPLPDTGCCVSRWNPPRWSTPSPQWTRTTSRTLARAVEKYG